MMKRTAETRILYKKGKEKELIAYCDIDYARDFNDRKSTSGFVLMLNVSVVSWSSKKQPVMTLFSTEAEFFAAAYCVCQGIGSNVFWKSWDKNKVSVP